jgi:hypothetical protein
MNMNQLSSYYEFLHEWILKLYKTIIKLYMHVYDDERELLAINYHFSHLYSSRMELKYEKPSLDVHSSYFYYLVKLFPIWKWWFAAENESLTWNVTSARRTTCHGNWTTGKEIRRLLLYLIKHTMCKYEHVNFFRKERKTLLQLFLFLSFRHQMFFMS